MRKLFTVLVATLAGCAVAWWIAGRPLGIDSSVYRAGALALLHREPLYEPLSALPAWGLDLPFIYPPFAAMVFVPLALLPVQLAWGAVAVASAFALRHTLRAFGGGPLLLVAVLVLDPLWSCLGLGQINLVLMAAITSDVLRPARHSGVLIGLAAAVKLTPLIFIPHLLLTGRRRDAVRASVTFAGVTALAALCDPTDSRQYWTSTVFAPQPPDRLARDDNQSLVGLIARTFDGSLPLYAALAILCLTATTLAVRNLHRTDPAGSLLITATCALLISPISWTNHWVWSAPLAAYLIRRKRWPALGITALVFTSTTLYAQAALAAGVFLVVQTTRKRSPSACWGTSTP